MNKLRSLFAANRTYFICYGVFFVIALVLLSINGKARSFIYLNPFHHSALDVFFVNFTYLGTGFFVGVVILILLLMRRWWPALEVFLSFALSGLLAVLLKNLFLMPRPKQFFPPGEYNFFIEGVTHTGFASFPSGHSTSVFALATTLALLERNKRWNIAYLLGAVAVGYSRIYLGQHFLNDVLVGSFLGTLTAIGIHWFFLERYPRLLEASLPAGK